MEQFTVRCSGEDFEEFKERAHQARQSLNAWAVAMLKGRDESVTESRPQASRSVWAKPTEPAFKELSVDRSVTQDPVEIAKQARIAEARRIQEEAMKREAPKKGPGSF